MNKYIKRSKIKVYIFILCLVVIIPALYNVFSLDMSFGEHVLLPSNNEEISNGALSKNISSHFKNKLIVAIEVNDLHVFNDIQDKIQKDLNLYLTQVVVDAQKAKDYKKELLGVMGKYPGAFVSDEDDAKLAAQNYEVLLDELKNTVFSLYSDNLNTHFEVDPLGFSSNYLSDLLTLNNMQHFLLRSGDSVFYIKDEFEEKYYGIFHFNFNRNVDDLKEIESFFQHFQLFQSSIEKSVVNIFVSGYPYQTALSQFQSKYEMSLLSVLSLGLIFILFYFTFKLSHLGLLFVVLGAAISAGCLAVLLCFNSIHIFTLIFCISILGLAVDYGIHYFVHVLSRYNDFVSVSSTKGLKKFWRAMLISIISTIVGYLVLFFSNVLLFQQIALFSIVGILAALATVWLIFPTEKKSDVSEKRNWIICFINELLSVIEAKVSRVCTISVIVSAFLCSLLLFLYCDIEFTNDVRQLEIRNEQLIKSKVFFSHYFSTNMASGFIITTGKKQSDVLTKIQALDSALKMHNLEGASVYTVFSGAKRQTETKAHMTEYIHWLLEDNRYASVLLQQADLMRIRDRMSEHYQDKWLADILALPLMSDFVSQYLYQKNGQWFGLIHLKEVSPHMLETFAQISKSLEHTLFYAPVVQANNVLDRLSVKLLWLVAVSLMAIFVCAVLLRTKQKFNAMLLIGCVVTSILLLFSCYGYVSFFHLLGLILVMGLSIDYMAFIFEDGNSHVTVVSIVLAGLTSLISFGVISLSSIPALVHIGSVVAAGILGAMLSVPFILAFKDKR